MADHGDRKTRPTSADVTAFLDGVADERRRADAWEVLDTMHRLTGALPRMWGSSIVGFGYQPYTHRTARSGTGSRSGCRPERPRSPCTG